MPEKKLKLKVVTPREVKLETDADMVVLRCVDGDIGIRSGHATCVAILGVGVLRVKNNGQEKRLAVGGGHVYVHDDAVSVIADEAEWPEDIDVRRAEIEREEAERRLRDHAEAIEVNSAQLLLRRALVRIEVSSYSIMHDTTSREE